MGSKGTLNAPSVLFSKWLMLAFRYTPNPRLHENLGPLSDSGPLPGGAGTNSARLPVKFSWRERPSGTASMTLANARRPPVPPLEIGTFGGVLR